MSSRGAAETQGMAGQGEAVEARSRTDYLKQDIVANVVVIGLLVLGMELWSRNVPAYIMPPPARSWSAIVDAVTEGYVNILLTLGRLLVSVAFALVVGSLIGALMALVRPLQPFIRSIVIIDTGVPALSWMLFAVFWFRDAEARVFFILAMILLPFYALNVYDGIRALSTDLVEMVETFRPSRWQLLRLLVLPHVIPYILMTTRSIIGYATRMTVFAELVSVNTGMGAQMSLAQNNFQMEGVIAWTVLLVILNLLLQGLVVVAEKSLLRWRPEVSVR